MYRIIVKFVSIEVVGLVGFIITSRYQEGMATRYLPLLFALVAVSYVAYSEAKTFSYKEIGYISVGVSTLLVLVAQLLGFTVYPGLAKGMDLLSGENLGRIGVMLSVGVLGHFLLISLARTMGSIGTPKPGDGD